MQQEEITLASCILFRPDERRHPRTFRPVGRQAEVSLDGMLPAKADRDMRLREVGHGLCDPVLHVPRDDPGVARQTFGRQNSCPLDGDWTRHAVDGETGADIGWCQDAFLDFAAAISGRVAFDASRASIEGTPA